MWQVYQYGHGKLKLHKDRKTGPAHLRVSLIQQQQFQNVGKIYNNRKDYYRINSNSTYVPNQSDQFQQQEATAHLSHKQKVQLYRKKLQNQKQQAKYNTLFKKIQKKRCKLRNPVIYKLLQNFQDNHKKQNQFSIITDLKESQKNLQMIKVNTNRRINYKQKASQSVLQQRPRFLSLQNGLPQKDNYVFLKWEEYILKKMTKNDKKTVSINIPELQSAMDNFIGNNHMKIKRQSLNKQQNTRDLLSPKRQRILSSRNNLYQSSLNEQYSINNCERCVKSKIQTNNQNNQNNMDKSLTKTYMNKKIYSRQKLNDLHNKNADKTFVKSQSYSKAVIQTMSGFYNSKKSKQKDFTRMAFYLKNDRPFTSDIRKKNYRIVGQQNILQLKKYRNSSQAQRKNLRQRNYNFYMSLLKQIQKYDIQTLNLSLKIIQRARIVLESNYLIKSQHFDTISQPSFYQKGDEASDIILTKIEDFIKYNDQNK